MGPNIRGEENSSFSNGLGETVVVRVADDPTETTQSLLPLLAGDMVAAELLTQEVHRDVVAELDAEIPELPMDGFNFSQMGLWVDPIGNVTCDSGLTHLIFCDLTVCGLC